MKLLDRPVPILGQAIKIEGFLAIVVLTCQCDAHTVMTLNGLQAVAQCPGCHKAYMIGKIVHDPAQRVGTVEIASVTVPAPVTN